MKAMVLAGSHQLSIQRMVLQKRVNRSWRGTCTYGVNLSDDLPTTRCILQLLSSCMEWVEL